MTHIVFLSPENKDSRIQMAELADDIYQKDTKEYYHHVDIAEIPSKYDVENEGKKLARFLTTMKPAGNPANVILVAYEDYAFVAIKALELMKMPPAALIVVNFPIANEKLFEWEQFSYLKDQIANNKTDKGNMYLLQADIMYKPVSEYLRKKSIKAEIVRVEDVTNVGELTSEIFSIIKKHS